MLSGKKPLVALASSGLDDADAKAPCPRFWPAFGFNLTTGYRIVEFRIPSWMEGGLLQIAA